MGSQWRLKYIDRHTTWRRRSVRVVLWFLLVVLGASTREPLPCLDLASTLDSCSGSLATPACCLAVQVLDSKGCFCDDQFESLAVVHALAVAARDTHLMACVPAPSRFSDCAVSTTASGCLNMTNGMLRARRVRTAERLWSLLTDDGVNNVVTTLANTTDLFGPEPRFGFIWDSLRGNYSTLEETSAYIAASSARVGPWRSTYVLAVDWAEGGPGNDTIGARFVTRDSFFNTSEGLQPITEFEFHFKQCSDRVERLMVWREPAVDVALAKAHKDEYVKATCSLIVSLCPAGVTGYTSASECESFMRALPRSKACVSATPRALLGNTSTCRLIHARALETSVNPSAFCGRLGMGLAPNVTHCVPGACTGGVDMNHVVLREKRSFIDLEQACNIDNDTSTPVAQMYADWARSPCAWPPAPRLEISTRPPNNSTRAALQSLCNPVAVENTVGSSYGCRRAHARMWSTLDMYNKSCSPVQTSQIPFFLTELTEADRRYRMSCTLGSAVPGLCAACAMNNGTGAAMAAFAEIAGNGHNQFDASPVAMANAAHTGLGTACRLAIHYACANIASERPLLCDACFFASTIDVVACRAQTDAFLATCELDAGEHSQFWFSDVSQQNTTKETTQAFDSYQGTPTPPHATLGYSQKSRATFDFIIVGAGVAGCVVARRLSDAGFSVLVLERGVDWRVSREMATLTGAPRLAPRAAQATPLVHGETTPVQSPGAGNESEVVWTASALGGGSTVGLGTYLRPRMSGFETWPNGWKGQDLAEFLNRAENYTAASRVGSFGDQGLMPIQDAPGHALLNEWLKTAWTNGFNASINPIETASGEDPGNHAAFAVPMTAQNGRKINTFSAYLDPILDRSDVEVRTDARVIRVLFETDTTTGKQRAYGVTYIAYGQARLRAYATREVILCAGWLGTPRLLQQSGWGAKDSLESAGLAAIYDTSSVGQGVRARAAVTMRFKGTALPPEADPVALASTSTFQKWALHGNGPLSVPAVAGAGRGVDAASDAQYAMFYRVEEGGDLAVDCVVCAPKSNGSVHVVSAGSHSPPRVSLNLLSEDDDTAALIACVRDNYKVMDAMYGRGADWDGWGDVMNGNGAALAQRVRSETKFHGDAFGGAAIGSVISASNMRVFGTSNLRVVDASVFPAAAGCGGTLPTVLAVAEKAASMIVDDPSSEGLVGSHVIDQAFEAYAVGYGLLGIGCAVAIALILHGVARHRAILYFYSRPKKRSAGANRGPQSATVSDETTTAATVATAGTVVAGRAISAAHVPTSAFLAPSLGRDGKTGYGARGRRRRMSKMTHSRRRTLKALDASVGIDILFGDLSYYVPEAGGARRAGGQGRAREKQLLKRVGGHFHKGQLSFIMGTSGAGKTTLLRILTQQVECGRVTGTLVYETESDRIVVGHSSAVQTRRYVRQNLAYVPQRDEQYYSHLTVRELLAFYHGLIVLPQLQTRSGVMPLGDLEDAISFLNLSRAADSPIGSISGGELRRVSVAIQMLGSPKGIVLDEPTSGLDSTTSVEVVRFLKDLAETKGMTVVATIHQPSEELMGLSDRLTVCATGGYVVYDGGYRQLKDILITNRRGVFPNKTAIDYLLEDLEDEEMMLMMHETWLSDYREGLRATLTSKLGSAIVRRARAPRAARRLRHASGWATSMLILSVFLGLTGRPQPWTRRLARSLNNFGVAIFCVLIAAFAVSLFPGLLPISATDEATSLVGAELVFTSALLSLFQVTVAMVLVEEDMIMYRRLQSRELIRPTHMVLFFFARGVVLVAASLASWFVWFYGLGFEANHVGSATLVFALFLVSSCASATLFHVVLGSAGAGLYGLWATMQIIFNGLAVNSGTVAPWWLWFQRANPMFYMLRIALSLELGVGRRADCGDYCEALMESIGYADADLLIAVLVLTGYAIGQYALIYAYLAMAFRAQQIEVDFEPAKSYYNRVVLELKSGRSQCTNAHQDLKSLRMDVSSPRMDTRSDTEPGVVGEPGGEPPAGARMDRILATTTTSLSSAQRRGAHTRSRSLLRLAEFYRNGSKTGAALLRSSSKRSVHSLDDAKDTARDVPIRDSVLAPFSYHDNASQAPAGSSVASPTSISRSPPPAPSRSPTARIPPSLGDVRLVLKPKKKRLSLMDDLRVTLHRRAQSQGARSGRQSVVNPLALGSGS